MSFFKEDGPMLIPFPRWLHSWKMPAWGGAKAKGLLCQKSSVNPPSTHNPWNPSTEDSAQSPWGWAWDNERGIGVTAWWNHRGLFLDPPRPWGPSRIRTIKILAESWWSFSKFLPGNNLWLVCQVIPCSAQWVQHQIPREWLWVRN